MLTDRRFPNDNVAEMESPLPSPTQRKFRRPAWNLDPKPAETVVNVIDFNAHFQKGFYNAEWTPQSSGDVITQCLASAAELSYIPKKNTKI